MQQLYYHYKNEIFMINPPPSSLTTTRHDDVSFCKYGTTTKTFAAAKDPIIQYNANRERQTRRALLWKMCLASPVAAWTPSKWLEVVSNCSRC